MAIQKIKRKGISLSVVNKVTEQKTVSISFGDEVLELTYNRSKYTPKFEREVKELMDSNLPANMLAKMVFALVTDWNLEDVVDPDAPEKEWEYEKVPLTLETFEALLSAEALATIVEALSEDNRPNQKPSDFTSNT